MLHPYERQALVFLTSTPRAAGDPAWDPYFMKLVENGLAKTEDGVYHITPSGHKELEVIDVVTGERLSPAARNSLVEQEKRDWRAKVLNAILNVAKKQKTFTIEDVRVAASDAGDPHHPNAWGAMLTNAKKKGWIGPTGTFTTGVGRSTRVWESKIRSKR